MDTPAKRLKFARNLRKMNQVQLALAAGVATGTVGNIESGTRGIKGSALKLANALSVDPNWLATGDGIAPGQDDGAQMTLLRPSSATPARAETLDDALKIIDAALEPLDAQARRIAANMLTGLESPGHAHLVAAMLTAAIESSKRMAA